MPADAVDLASTQGRRLTQHLPVNDEPISAPPEDSQHPMTQPPTRRTRTRGTIVSQFKGFDDGFEPPTFSMPKREFGGSSQNAAPTGTSQQNSV